MKLISPRPFSTFTKFDDASDNTYRDEYRYHDQVASLFHRTSVEADGESHERPSQFRRYTCVVQAERTWTRPVDCELTRNCSGKVAFDCELDAERKGGYWSTAHEGLRYVSITRLHHASMITYDVWNVTAINVCTVLRCDLNTPLKSCREILHLNNTSERLRAPLSQPPFRHPSLW